MAIGSFGFALALMLLLLVVNAQNTALVSYLCNTEKIPDGSPFFDTLDNLLVDLEENTANSFDYGFDYKTSIAGSPGSPTAYGEARCVHDPASDYTDCLYSLSDRIWDLCDDAIGAQVQLNGCFMRYEQFSF